MTAYARSIIEYPTHCRFTNIYKCVAVAIKQQCQLNDKCNNVASSLLCHCNSTMKKTIAIIDIFRYCGYSRVNVMNTYNSGHISFIPINFTVSYDYLDCYTTYTIKNIARRTHFTYLQML